MEDAVQLLLNKLVGMALEHNIDIAPQRHLREPPCPAHFRPISFSVWTGWPFSGMGHQREAAAA